MRSVHGGVVASVFCAFFALTARATLQELEQAYSAQQSESCGKVLSHVPAFDTKDADDFMSAYKKFDGTGDETPVITLASKLLSEPEVTKFFSLPDSFMSGGLDSELVRCAVLSQATPLQLAQFAVQGSAQEALVNKLFDDTLLMRDMLVAGGATQGKYGEAMDIYGKMVKASKVLSHSTPTTTSTPWDDRNQSTVLRRLALGTAVHQAVPIQQRWPQGDVVDPVERYLHYEQAYLAGDLDPAFEVLTAFECRYVTAFTGTNADLAWLRETMGNYRPDDIAMSDYHWRYATAVHEVAYGDPVWPDGSANFRDIPAAGGVCGPRAWFGRFTRRAFGLPTWGVQQPGHAALTTWTPSGWAVLLGAGWTVSRWDEEHRSGSDFVLETQCREFRSDFQQVLRGQCVAHAKNETPVSRSWTPSSAKSYGIGGFWGALMLYAKKISVTVTHKGGATPRPMGPSVVPTKVEKLIARWDTVLPAPKITVGPDGSITIPAVAYSYKNHSAQITTMKSFDDGEQLLHSGGNFIDPAATAVEYEITVDTAEMFYFTVNFTTWHMDTDLQLSTNTTTQPLLIPVYYTVGYWKETPLMQVNLVKGKNVLRITRQSTRELAIKSFSLLTQRPVVPPIPRNHSPAPAPPPVVDYIELPAGTTCERQGILAMTEKECGIACEYFGYKYTGSRHREFFSGCFAITSGQYKGNCNYNSNASAVCCDPDARAVCLRGSVDELVI